MKSWWRDRVAYQIYPRSFQDTDGNGIGDLRGIIKRLPYLKELGIGILWLSPVYRSPNDDNGYDISDYRSIHPDFGTMSEMDKLLQLAEKLDIKVIMDLVINHTSDEHEWFKESRNPDSPYRDYYIWRPGKNGKKPNNWTSFFAEDCWEFDERSGEYFLHLFSKKQPDLNYRNPKVIEEVKDIMRFWLEKGVAGFRCDVINVIWKESLANGRKRFILTGREHYLTNDGTHEILRELRRDVLSQFDCFAVGETVMVTPKSAFDLSDPSRGELDMLFSFEHMDTDSIIVKWFKKRFKPQKFCEVIAKWQTALEWNANYFENHDQPRSVSRFGDDQNFHDESARMLCVLLLSLRGTPFIYQGQEIGMTDFDFTSMDQIRDVESLNVYRLATRLHIPKSYRWKMILRSGRDNARTPMQWSAGKNAGFSTGTPWLGINGNHTKINVEAQDKDPNSVLAFYRKMIRLRNHNKLLRSGAFRSVEISRKLFVFERIHDKEKITVVINFSGNPGRYNASGKLLLSTYERIDYDGSLAPYEAVLLSGRNEG
ncbi:MAG: alpha-glucosidase [Clostridiaceae bacterium]|jgi:oligo-1,6-glucosidase|nr:alpha-glucosidase [Oscillospiraceae bacterium]NLO62732.1 alpha-glucosidase [Clostridiaceae bacterium]